MFLQLKVMIRKSFFIFRNSKSLLCSIENLKYLGSKRIRGLRSLLNNHLINTYCNSSIFQFFNYFMGKCCKIPQYLSIFQSKSPSPSPAPQWTASSRGAPRSSPPTGRPSLPRSCPCVGLSQTCWVDLHLDETVMFELNK